MVDPLSTLGVQAGKEVLQGTRGVFDKLLGPIAEEAGEDLRLWYQRRRNIRRVVDRAGELTDTDEPGAIPPRVAAEIFDKAQWADDEFVAEYLSGVLASSRTAEGTSDAGVPWTALVGRLSADQLRLHWVLYSAFRQNVVGRDADEFWSWVRSHLIVELGVLFEALQWPLSSQADTLRLWDAVYGLQREELLSDVSHGNGDYLRESVSWTKGRDIPVEKMHLVYRVSASGVGLLLNAAGAGRRWYSDIAKEEIADAVSAVGDLPAPPITPFVKDLPLLSAKSDTPSAEQ